MTINSLKEFKALIKACRSLGVDAIEVGDLKVVIGKEPFKASNKAIDEIAFPEASIQVPRFNGDVEAPDKPLTDELTEEQLMFFSAQGHEEIQQ